MSVRLRRVLEASYAVYPVLLQTHSLRLLNGSRQNLLALSEHVQIQLGEYWDIRQHHETEKERKREGKVVFVRHGVRPLARLAGSARGRVDAKELSRHAQWIQSDEQGVTQEYQERGLQPK